MKALIFLSTGIVLLCALVIPGVGMTAATKSGTISVFPGGIDNVSGVYREGYTMIKIPRNKNSGTVLAKGLTLGEGEQQFTSIPPQAVKRLCRASNVTGWDCTKPSRTIGASEDFPFKKSKGGLFWEAIIHKTPDTEPGGTFVAVVNINGFQGGFQEKVFWFIFPKPTEKTVFWSFRRCQKGLDGQRSIAVRVLPNGGQTAYGQYVSPTIVYTGSTLTIQFGTVHEYVARGLLFSLDPALTTIGAVAQWNTLQAPPINGSFRRGSDGARWETIITGVPPGCGNISYANGNLWQMVEHPLLKTGAGIEYCESPYGKNFLLR